MKIQVADAQDFVAEIALPETRVHSNVVRFQIYRNPEQEQQISFDVAVLATAILMDESGRAYALLEYIAECGRDSRRDGNAGSDRAGAIRADIARACEARGLVLRPGKFELF